MRILVLNAGSSSLKFRLFDAPHAPTPPLSTQGSALGTAPVPPLSTQDSALSTISSGAVSGIGGRPVLTIEPQPAESPQAPRLETHHEAVTWLLEHLERESIDAVGHRVVHGGTRFSEPVRVDEGVIAELDQLTPLAPLHNPPSLATIRAARRGLPAGVPMVAVFDTAFHAGMPPTGSLYALPQDVMRRHAIRRYGFHGIAHASMARRCAAVLGRPLERLRLITLQLGNGCSATAIRGGRSVDTSMGMTPLEGLVMGTRSGDVDPAVVPYLARCEAVEAGVVEQWLNERSGLLGLSGLSNDVRVLLDAESRGQPNAKLALELFCYRVRKYLGAYLAVLGGVEAVAFGGGIGEHAPAIRERICEGMDWCGLVLDTRRNREVVALSPGETARVSADGHLPVFVVAVDEESEIARETVRVLAA
ncbi:acetate/propionate family kinase [Candidatus Nitrospira bockiana]